MVLDYALFRVLDWDDTNLSDYGRKHAVWVQVKDFWHKVLN
jgi:hypothetical protein